MLTGKSAPRQFHCQLYRPSVTDAGALTTDLTLARSEPCRGREGGGGKF